MILTLHAALDWVSPEWSETVLYNNNETLYASEITKKYILTFYININYVL